MYSGLLIKARKHINLEEMPHYEYNMNPNKENTIHTTQITVVVDNFAICYTNLIMNAK